MIVAENVRIGEVGGQRQVVPDARTEQKRSHAGDQKLKAGQIARVAIEQPVRTVGGRPYRRGY